MCDGKFCKAIERPEYEGLVFLSATTLELQLNKDTVRVLTFASSQGPASTPESDPEPVITKEQVASFARSVRLLTRAASGVIIDYESIPDSSENANDLYSTLLTELYGADITRMEVYAGADQPTLFSMTIPTGMTSIVHGVDMMCAPFAQISYHNSSTLRKLDIGLDTEADWRVLLYGGTEDLASFECLASLEMYISDTLYTTTWAAIADAAPFSALSTLDVSGGYPFDDDVLFRGSGQTMQSLRLPFSALVRNALGRFNVLKRKGAGRLNAVHIGPVTDVDNTFVAGLAVVPIKRQIRRILKVAAILSIQNDTSESQIVIFMAILCPKFVYVDIAPELRNAFGREIAWASCNHPFEPYADSIRRLIYKE
ncbi:hypothetical protein IWW38_002162 [Coemansia aciculifera]|uniref:Uncharacterized protein n=1 Tax=Coemansia aciculifera TaxID=417176 RepID=A0ACC1M5Z6_9FUNG|nr:hypothetical protein IWW38_002162 [Coemansia aciculifera]